ncbi:MAG: hypothetical protein KDD41_06900 [Flavobacteriales bacterium]|nr:hypothetical protein [Flavobacteriales bacterium]
MKKTLLTIIALAFFSVAFSQTNNNQDITLVEENGVKTLTIKTTVDGKETVETFNGKDADEKLHSMEMNGGFTKTEVVAADGTLQIKIQLKQATAPTK